MNGLPPVLDVQHLSVALPTPRGTVQAVRDASLQLHTGELLALVGESGCGKSVTAQALLGLLPATARLQATRLRLAGQSLLDPATRAAVRGRQVSMVFQNPMATFNPTLTVGYQIAEPLRLHLGLSRHEAEAEAVRLMERMHIRAARQALRAYPGAFSGGMLQRAAIAMALAARPLLLIADEPTTALDSATQQEILGLLTELREEHQLAVLLITHDLRLVRQHAQRVAVMYAGETVECAPTAQVLQSPQHPYTAALLAALPADRARAGSDRLREIGGAPPDLRQPITGCAFLPRCARAMQICALHPPPVYADAQQARCWQHHPDCPGPDPAHGAP